MLQVPVHRAGESLKPVFQREAQNNAAHAGRAGPGNADGFLHHDLCHRDKGDAARSRAKRREGHGRQPPHLRLHEGASACRADRSLVGGPGGSRKRLFRGDHLRLDVGGAGPHGFDLNAPHLVLHDRVSPFETGIRGASAPIRVKNLFHRGDTGLHVGFFPARGKPKQNRP